MIVYKCKMCGGDLQISEGASIAECEYCGSVQTVPKVDDEKKLTLFSRANRLRAACEFDKAAGVYESIVADFPEEAEAYWGLILCKYGIEYVDDPATGKKIPTCHRSSFDSVMDDSDLEQVLENADTTARRVYREEAKAIEELRKGIVAVSANEEPYDIFICYKETADDGNRTLDSVLAQDVYTALTDKGYRVFFSRISLEDKLGVEYEPYIFAALNSAKIMLAFGTDYEYFNAVWVKNEWSRYLKLMAKDKDKHLIPCYKGIDAYDMPKEFAKLQAQDMGKVGATQDLLRGIEKILPRQKVAVATPTAPVTNPLVKRGYIYLEDKDYPRATEYFEKALDEDPENAEAYLGKVFAQLRIQCLEELQSLPISLNAIPDLQKAVRYADSSLKNRLSAILETNVAQMANSKSLVERIQSGTVEDMLRLVPILQQAMAGIPAGALKDTFGADLAEIEKVLVEYEVYSIFENTTEPMNTTNLREKSSRIAKLDDATLRRIIVRLNHAGYLLYEDWKFSFLSEGFRNSKNEEYRAKIQKTIDETEEKLANLRQREAALPGEIAGEQKNLEDNAQAYAEAAQQAEQMRQAVKAEISADTQTRDTLLGQIRSLEAEASKLGLFQGKRKKEIAEQVAALRNQTGALNGTIDAKTKQLTGMVAANADEERAKRKIAKLEKELQTIPAEISKLETRSAELKAQRDNYQWKPGQIDENFLESDPFAAYEFAFAVESIDTSSWGSIRATGTVKVGTVRRGDMVYILHTNGRETLCVVDSLLVGNLFEFSATAGDKASLDFKDVTIERGDIVIKKTIDEDAIATYIKTTFPGQKLEAIKYYRKLTGLGLKEAKDYIDTLM